MILQPATIETIKIIAKALGELNEKAVFVGGAVIPFYLPSSYFSLARPTEDIDVVMEIVGRQEGWINDEVLRSKGFQHDQSEGAPICRWTFRGFKIDVMSADSSSMGFTNRWYKEGVARSIEIIKEPVSVKIFNLTYFLASKVVAFRDRGNNDYMASRDMEDIISLLEVAYEEIFEKDLQFVSADVRDYLSQEFSSLIEKSEFIDCIPGAVFNRLDPKSSSEYVLNRMKKYIQLSK